MFHHFRISKARAKAFANEMEKIELFCAEHGISSSRNNDSYYFSCNGIRYRVSNHTVASSNDRATNWMGEQVREKYHPNGEEGMVCITAGKTRIIEIWNNLNAGKKLDRRGNVIGE